MADTTTSQTTVAYEWTPYQFGQLSEAEKEAFSRNAANQAPTALYLRPSVFPKLTVASYDPDKNGHWARACLFNEGSLLVDGTKSGFTRTAAGVFALSTLKRNVSRPNGRRGGSNGGSWRRRSTLSVGRYQAFPSGGRTASAFTPSTTESDVISQLSTQYEGLQKGLGDHLKRLETGEITDENVDRIEAPQSAESRGIR